VEIEVSAIDLKSSCLDLGDVEHLRSNPNGAITSTPVAPNRATSSAVRVRAHKRVAPLSALTPAPALSLAGSPTYGTTKVPLRRGAPSSALESGLRYDMIGDRCNERCPFVKSEVEAVGELAGDALAAVGRWSRTDMHTDVASRPYEQFRAWITRQPVALR